MKRGKSGAARVTGVRRGSRSEARMKGCRRWRGGKVVGTARVSRVTGALRVTQVTGTLQVTGVTRVARALCCERRGHCGQRGHCGGVAGDRGGKGNGGGEGNGGGKGVVGDGGDGSVECDGGVKDDGGVAADTDDSSVEGVEGDVGVEGVEGDGGGRDNGRGPNGAFGQIPTRAQKVAEFHEDFLNGTTRQNLTRSQPGIKPVETPQPNACGYLYPRMLKPVQIWVSLRARACAEVSGEDTRGAGGSRAWAWAARGRGRLEGMESLRVRAWGARGCRREGLEGVGADGLRTCGLRAQAWTVRGCGRGRGQLERVGADALSVRERGWLEQAWARMA
ncbi:hypothetical protein OF83DRAFT_1087696 [Amylostereum chailletii]|nr:hypothetical protein OF83DRAFT_1087696 [Amylostereum chailletii]